FGREWGHHWGLGLRVGGLRRLLAVPGWVRGFVVGQAPGGTMSDASKKRLFAVGAILVALVALWWMSRGKLGDNLVYYWTPTELRQKDAADATVRLGGMVVPGSVNWDKQTHVMTFDLTDGQTLVHVRNEGNPPQMFREGIGAVVEGKLGGDDVFHSDK